MFSRTTYQTRLADYCHRMGEADIDVSVITTPESITYLAGIEIGVAEMAQYLIVSREGLHSYVTRQIEVTWQSRWEENSWCSNWIGVPDDEDFTRVVVEQIRSLSHRSRRIVLAAELERRSVSYAEIKTWAAGADACEIVSGTALAESMRVVKSEAEIALMREVCRVTAVGMDAGISSLAAGRTELEIQRDVANSLEDAGSGPLAGNWAASGPETYRGHLSGRPRRPERGELTTLMTSASRDRYVGPLERTVAVSTLASEPQKLLTTVRGALKHALDRLKPGMTSHAADALVRDFYADRGLDKFFVNRLAYSIGMAFPTAWWENEIMQLRAGDERIVKPGMTFHLVPSLHVPEIGFLQSSMPVVITEDGCEPLSEYAIDLPPVEIP